MDEWFYVLDDSKQGPISLAFLREYIETAQLPADTLVWSNGLPEWVPANTIEELNVAPPPVYVPPPYVRSKLPPPGGLMNRVVAVFMDNMLVMAVSFGISFLIATVWQKYSPELTEQQYNAHLATGLLICYYGLDWLYFATLESSAGGATLGKRLLGIRVVNAEGDRISFLRATGRFFSKFLSGVMGIGYAMAFISDKEQALHDQLAKTFVVRARKK